ncbi:hypothetical protein PUF88_00335 [Lactobacillaceae bacterium L1_55_11]|nr:hypothetical protein [Lactobacillaceae bacterium L1_55_11]
MLNPNDLRSISHKDERYQRAIAILNDDWPQLLLDFPRTNHYITQPDIDFALRLSENLDQYQAWELNHFSQVQAFISQFQSYLSSSLIKHLQEPFYES